VLGDLPLLENTEVEHVFPDGFTLALGLGKSGSSTSGPTPAGWLHRIQGQGRAGRLRRAISMELFVSSARRPSR
jgi:hypothetical protein